MCTEFHLRDTIRIYFCGLSKLQGLIEGRYCGMPLRSIHVETDLKQGFVFGYARSFSTGGYSLL